MALLALLHPFSHNPDTEELAKYLGDFGRSGKVSLLAELVSIGSLGGVVTVAGGCEALAHIRCNGNGTCCLHDLVNGLVTRVISLTLIASASFCASGVDHFRGEAVVEEHLAHLQTCAGALQSKARIQAP